MTNKLSSLLSQINAKLQAFPSKHFIAEVSLYSSKISELNDLLTLSKNQNDPELHKLTTTELQSAISSLEDINLKLSLADSNSKSNCIVEIRAGSGGIFKLVLNSSTYIFLILIAHP